MKNDITYALGFAERHRAAAAALYEQAFGAKFALAIPKRDQRIALLTACLVPDFAFAAVANNELVGLAGFHALHGSLTSGVTMHSLRAQMGLFRGLWAAAVFSLFERSPEPGELVMDGIAVRDDMRGYGIGGQLLDLLAHYAQAQGYTQMRLDVIETNPGARRLYERKGFQPVETQHFPYLKWLIGFGAATRMTLRVAPTAQASTQEAVSGHTASI